MADKALRRLKRRELLQMLLIQCEETEKCQKESAEIKEQMEVMTESYERLKKKLDVKDERLNEKDEKIAELKREIEEMKRARERELEEAASIAGATQRLNVIFEEAQRAADQYLLSMRKAEMKSLARTEETKKKQSASRGGQIVSMSFGQRGAGYDRSMTLARETEKEHRAIAAVSGDIYGR